MQIILNSIQELKELASLIGDKAPVIGEYGQAKQENSKADNKPAVEKVKKDKVKDKKENVTSDSTVKPIAKEDKYYYHPESDSYWMLPKGEIIPTGIDFEHSNEISKEEYETATAEETPKIGAEVTGIDETPIEEPPKDAEVTEESKEPEVTKVTKEMVRAICSQAIKAGKSAEVKNIVSKYGASKLPDLKEECYADAYKDVEAVL